MIDRDIRHLENLMQILHTQEQDALEKLAAIRVEIAGTRREIERARLLLADQASLCFDVIGDFASD